MTTTHTPTAVLVEPATSTPPVRTVAVGRRTAAVALVVGAALNTAEAVVTGAVLGGRDRSPAEELAAAVANPGATVAIAVLGIASVPALLVGFQAMAHLVRFRLPRFGAVAAVLTYVGVLGFMAMQGLSLVKGILIGDGTRHTDAILALQESPLALVAVAPFLLGMFGGMALLTAGLFAHRRVPRWIPVAFALFWLLDLAVGAVGPVDPHWLFLAGSAGLAVAVIRAGDQRWRDRSL